MKRACVFDIETVGQDPERLLALAPAFKPAANLKDPVKIAASIEEKRQAYLERAALDWKTAHVVLVGFHDGVEFQAMTGEGREQRAESRKQKGDETRHLTPALSPVEAERVAALEAERDVIGSSLALIGRMLNSGTFVGGHNIKGFDLPMLINRARLLGAPIPEGIMVWFRGRFGWHEGIFDTLEILSFGRSFEGNGCDDCARAFGLPGKTGSGADFPALWAADREAAIAYNRRDCEIEIQLAAKCGF